MTYLIKSKKQIDEDLSEQINKLNHITESAYFNYLSGRSEYEEEEKRWIKYTTLLLQKCFSDHSFANEFSANPIPLVMTTGQVSDIENYEKLKVRVKKRVSILKSIKERICLLDEMPAELPLKAPDVNSVTTKKESRSKKSALMNSKVFIVHGHDDALKESVARFLDKLGLIPIILHEQASQSRTIIEKIEVNSDVGFGICLYTECDVGAVKSSSETLNSRARQNVVFEHGFLIGKLGREKVAALVKGEVEKPNDISGVVYISANDRTWESDLGKELKQAGYDIDFNKLF